MKRVISICLIALFCAAIASVAIAAEKENTGSSVKSFWQKLFSYPANVTKESANVVADTGKNAVNAVAKEVTTVGQVTSGETEKAKDLIVEPVKDVADTTAQAVQGTVAVPVEAAKQ